MSNQVFLRSISAVRIGVNGKSDLHAVMRIINATFETGPFFQFHHTIIRGLTLPSHLNLDK